jgi:opacity protein-like surface antigen
VKALTITLTLVAAMSLSPAAFAQGFEITPFLGYRLGGSLTDYYSGSSYSLDDSESYGVFVNIDLDPFGEYQLELAWSRQDTTLDISGFPGNRSDVTVDYFQVGGLRFFSDDDTIRPYLVGSLGATHLSPDDSAIGSTTRFSLGLGGGIKIMPSEHIGLRLEARGLATFVSSYAAVGCGYPGCGVSWGGSVFWQGDFTAGLVVRF